MGRIVTLSVTVLMTIGGMGAVLSQAQQQQRQQGMTPAQTSLLDQLARGGQLPPIHASDLRPYASPDLAAQRPDKYRPAPTDYQSPQAAPSRYDPDMEAASRETFPGGARSRSSTGWKARSSKPSRTR
jgi:uncharacterized protein YceK